MGDPPWRDPPIQKNVEASQAVQTPMDVLINVLESSIDTDCSISESSKLKRSKVFNSSDCQCTQNKEAELMSSPVAPLNGQLVLNKDIESNPKSVGRSFYQESDVAPFIVHVQRETLTEKDDTVGIGPWCSRSKSYTVNE
ncbi:hypothetical protein ACJJTC_000883 [Scirpophaga incertulas]